MTAKDQALILPSPSTNTVATNDIRAIRAPVAGIRTPFKAPIDTFTVFEIIAGAVIWVLIIALIIRYRRKRAAESTRVMPPHERARLRLAQALKLIHEPYWFCSEVSSATRDYLEDRFSFHAPDRTTEEFLLELQSTSLLSPQQKQSLSSFLEQCDLVKFARHVPTEVELRELHSSALRLVSETEPPPLATLSAPPVSPVPPTLPTSATR
jgi:hypothetical protein